MTTTMVPAVYEHGTFQVLEPVPNLPDKQKVNLFYIDADDPFNDFLEKIVATYQENG